MIEYPLRIREANPWIKLLDGVLEMIPIVEWITGLILHPCYVVSKPDAAEVMRIRKQPAFLESRFSLESTQPLDPIDEQRVLLSTIMLVLLERARG